MTINARFQSKCSVCGQPISVGQKVNWEPGKKATHVACGRPTASSKQPRISAGEMRKYAGRQEAIYQSEQAFSRGHGPLDDCETYRGLPQRVINYNTPRDSEGEIDWEAVRIEAQDN